MKQMRCQKCYRLHDLEYLSIQRTIGVAYRCPFHKKSAQGYFYIFKLGYHPGLRILDAEFKGFVQHIKGNMYEANPNKENITVIQEALKL